MRKHIASKPIIPCSTPKHKAFRDLTGCVFERLTVLELHGRRSLGHARGYAYFWLCQCSCGSTTIVSSINLTAGDTQSCGCLCRERAGASASARFFVHGQSHESTYNTWSQLLDRCRNPNNKGWKNYGGRGIAVCERWHTFANFLADMGHRPSPELTIERIDNNGNYEPSNCRWATRNDQMRNRRTSRPLLTFRDRTMSIVDWAAITGLNYYMIHSRLRLGWSVEQTLTTPRCNPKNLT